MSIRGKHLNNPLHLYSVHSKGWELAKATLNYAKPAKVMLNHAKRAGTGLGEDPDRRKQRRSGGSSPDSQTTIL